MGQGGGGWGLLEDGAGPDRLAVPRAVQLKVHRYRLHRGQGGHVTSPANVASMGDGVGDVTGDGGMHGGVRWGCRRPATAPCMGLTACMGGHVPSVHRCMGGLQALGFRPCCSRCKQTVVCERGYCCLFEASLLFLPCPNALGSLPFARSSVDRRPLSQGTHWAEQFTGFAHTLALFPPHINLESA